MSRRWLTRQTDQPLSLRDAMDRLFEESFVRGGLEAGAMSFPRIDVHQTDSDYVITAAIPGVKPDDVEITVDEGTVHIRGEVRRDERVEEEQYLYQERSFGQFARSLTLPGAVRTDAAEAEFRDGILTLRLPKPEETRPRRIKISGGEKQVSPARGSEGRSSTSGGPQATE